MFCVCSSLCRQMVTDLDGNVMEFNIDGTYASLTITGRDGIVIAIVSTTLNIAVIHYIYIHIALLSLPYDFVQFQDSIIAVPVDDWNLEIIHPRLKCVRQNKQSVYPPQPYSTCT